MYVYIYMYIYMYVYIYSWGYSIYNWGCKPFTKYRIPFHPRILTSFSFVKSNLASPVSQSPRSARLRSCQHSCSPPKIVRRVH